MQVSKPELPATAVDAMTAPANAVVLPAPTPLARDAQAHSAQTSWVQRELMHLSSADFGQGHGSPAS